MNVHVLTDFLTKYRLSKFKTLYNIGIPRDVLIQVNLKLMVKKCPSSRIDVDQISPRIFDECEHVLKILESTSERMTSKF